MPQTSDAGAFPEARQVLLVEDEESHALIIRRSFERHGASFEVTVASSLSEGHRAMANRTFDLIISDWRLPDGEGFELLAEKPHCPLLIMTSHGNERIAVEAMRAGALDYIVKSEASLLDMPRMAEGAIRLWESLAAKERAQEELRIAEETFRERRKEAEWFRLVVEAAPNAMIMVAADGLMTLVNTQTEALFGYGRRELLGRPLEMLVPERFRAAHHGQRNAFVAASCRRPVGRAHEMFGLRRDGSEVPVLIGLDTIATASGQFVLATIVDVTERRKEEERLQLFHALIEGVQDYGIIMLDPQGCVFSWNAGAARMMGYPANEILGKGLARFHTPEDVAAGCPAYGLQRARTEAKFEEEGWRVRRDGSQFWASILITVLLDKETRLRGFSTLIRDITERKIAREKLLESERSLRQLADAMPQIVWTARPDGYVDSYNQQWYEFTGFERDLGGDKSWEPILHPGDVPLIHEVWYSSVKSGQPYEVQCRFWDRKYGAYRWVLIRGLPMRDELGKTTKWVGTCTDIDDHKRLSEELERRVEERTKELQKSLIEKTTLLKEVHHRVKNNLQVVCSLLSMQIACLNGESYKGPLNDAHSRVLAMSLIHEQIYQSETLAHLDFGDYIELLSNRLFQAYCVDTTRIRLELSVESVHLTVDDAIPCGLIVNELLSNSLKHAFKDGREGVIRISLRKTGAHLVELTVADNGIGLPAGFRWEDSKSLGLQVVHTLIKQLRADLTMSGEGGATFRFAWKLPEAEIPELRN